MRDAKPASIRKSAARSAAERDSVAACIEAACFPCRLGRDCVANALAEIKWSTRVVGAARSSWSGAKVKDDAKALLSTLQRLESLIGGEPGRELLGTLGIFTAEPLDAVFRGRQLLEVAALLKRDVAAAIRAEAEYRAASGPGSPGLFGVERAFTPEALRLLALGDLYETMFGRTATATDNGPFYQFVAAAFEHWALPRPGHAMVRRHLERYPPRPLKELSPEGSTER